MKKTIFYEDMKQMKMNKIQEQVSWYEYLADKKNEYYLEQRSDVLLNHVPTEENIVSVIQCRLFFVGKDTLEEMFSFLEKKANYEFKHKEPNKEVIQAYKETTWDDFNTDLIGLQTEEKFAQLIEIIDGEEEVGYIFLDLRYVIINKRFDDIENQ
ncbi:hypothetical protein IW492_11890 [Enterococcus sp. BWB1-3]|uniref:hypothetical protein n=1 Tax=Enterococcus sp. BWB1-3 TaxID=2787713 RepID=UPI00192340E5|nr:hypothetical protein [Enterococcus sp. BWB1-3]MBL1229934.1 hypothetical protein [Enterococcus sp. BWB1-3]